MAEEDFAFDNFGAMSPRAGEDRTINFGVSAGSCVASRRVALDPMEWPTRHTGAFGGVVDGVSSFEPSRAVVASAAWDEEQHDNSLARIAKAMVAACLGRYHRAFCGRSVNPNPTVS